MAQTEEPRLDATETKVAVPLHKEGCSIADYRKIVRLGEGTFGEVWKAERGGFPVALKILNKSLNSEDAQRELKSLEMLKKLHHKYLIHTENFWSDGDRLFIEMELADGGTLKDRMKAFQAAGKLGIPEDELLKYFLEAAKALDYMHGHRPVFLHRDIKPHNILLVQGCAKLADFGLLRQVTGDNTSTKTSGGTPVYMAPESITEDKFSVQTDLWSFAVTYAELRQGRLPFVDKTQFNIFKKICQEPPYLTDVFHPDEKNVLLKALEKDPHHRFSSCGEFVFELNRVVPWVPATEITVLELPEGSESTPFAEVNSRVPVSDMPPASEFGTSRKRSPNTMQDFELPGVGGPSGSAPTLSRQDGTVSSDPDRRSAPAPEETAKKPRTDQGTDKVVAPDRPKPMPAAAPLEKKFEAAPPAPPPPPRRTKSRQSTLARLFLSTVILAVFAGIGWIGYLAVTSKDADNKKKPDEQPKVVSAADIEKEVEAAIASDNLVQATDLVDKNKSILDQRAKPLVEKIANKKKVLAFFASAKALINKDDYVACLALVKQTDAPFDYSQDKQRKDNLKRSAETGRHEQLVAEVRKQIRQKDKQQQQRIGAALKTLKEFRNDHPRPSWSPEFKEMPLPVELVAAAWKSLLDKKTDVADCRVHLRNLQAYSNPAQPDQYVLDPAYEITVNAIEALVQAHEAEQNAWPAALANVVIRLREQKPPTDLTPKIWLALEKLAPRFRIEDLETLPPLPGDADAKTANQRLFAQVLERLIKASNSAWMPTKTQAGSIVAWIPKRTGDPGPWLRALQTECLVLSGGDDKAIEKVEFQKQTGWYGAFVYACAEHHSGLKNKDSKWKDRAAETLTKLFENEPTAALKPAERMGRALVILRDAVRSLPREDGDFKTKAAAEKGVRWLMLVLSILDKQVQASGPDELADLALAAVKSEAPKVGDILKMVATRLDKLPPAEKVKGYHLLARAYNNDLDQATATLAGATLKNKVWDAASQASRRAEEFAYVLRTMEPLKTAAELNAKAVVLEATVVFSRTEAGKQRMAQYGVFETAIEKARNAAPMKKLDAFALPVVVAKLEALNFSESVLKSTIDEARAVLLDLPLPEGVWWENLQAAGLGRMADHQLQFALAKTKVITKSEEIKIYTEALRSYKIANEKKQYREVFPGDLTWKIAGTYYRLHSLQPVKFKKADVIKALDEAKSRLALNKTPPKGYEKYFENAKKSVGVLLEKLNQ